MKPVTTPAAKDIGKTKMATSGLEAINKNAASPMVAVRAAKTAPKDTFPEVYAATTMTAPPQPGVAPKSADIGICNNFDFFKVEPMLNLNILSDE